MTVGSADTTVDPRYDSGPDTAAVTGLETLNVSSVFDPDGRFNPRLVDGTESVLACDSVIMAIGQAPDLSWLAPLLIFVGVVLFLARQAVGSGVASLVTIQ